MSYKVGTSCLSFSLVIICLQFCLPVLAQKKTATPSPYDFSALDQAIGTFHKSLGSNYVFLVWKDGKPIYERDRTEDFTARTQAPIGGAANWMTAALVMTFVDEGKLSLDDKVSKYIPIFSTYMKTYITIRNCLTNTTGIHAGEDEGEKVMPKIKYPSLEEEVNAYASKTDIATNPGTEFFYSPIGPNIAARVLEVITKKSFDRLMMERILRPLKMHGTTFANQEGGALNASGGASSTADDYMTFLNMLMNKGMFENKRVLSEKAVEELEKEQFINLPVKFVPKSVQGDHQTLGAWITSVNASGAVTGMICSDFAGTTAFFDSCRNYSAILIVEKPTGAEETKNIDQTLKSRVEEAIGGSGCN